MYVSIFQKSTSDSKGEEQSDEILSETDEEYSDEYETSDGTIEQLVKDLKLGKASADGKYKLFPADAVARAHNLFWKVKSRETLSDIV